MDNSGYICPKCKKRLSEDDLKERFCSSCRYRFYKAEIEVVTETTQPHAEKQCLYCGTPIVSDSYVLCSICEKPYHTWCWKACKDIHGGCKTVGCKKTDSDVVLKEGVGTTAESTVIKDKKICRNCRKEVANKNAYFCSACEGSFEEEAWLEPTEKQFCPKCGTELGRILFPPWEGKRGFFSPYSCSNCPMPKATDQQKQGDKTNKANKMVYVVLGLIILVAIILAIARAGREGMNESDTNNATISSIKEKVGRVGIGMTQSEVLSICGEPTDKQGKGEDLEGWFYWNDGKSHIVMFRNGKVEDVEN